MLIPMVEPLLRAPTGARRSFSTIRAPDETFFGAYGATKAAQIALARVVAGGNASRPARVS